MSQKQEDASTDEKTKLQDAGVNRNPIPSNKIDPQSEAVVVSQVPGHNPEVDSSSEKSPD